MEDREDYIRVFAHEFMLFAIELNETLRENNIEEIKF